MIKILTSKEVFDKIAVDCVVTYQLIYKQLII